ncbi:MAG: hypothetical protein KJ023_00285 [Burkholderiaceae bacterium]|nr:hypothetical protein [Burkholderiaceae bacterium]
MGTPVANARAAIRLRSGMWVRLPSGRIVQLIDHSSSRNGTVWSCGYVEGTAMRGAGERNRQRLVLRHDWLQRHAELVR